MSSRVQKILKDPRRLFLTLGQRGFFNWMDDEAYIEIAYKILMGKPLNLDNPHTYSEKMQWLKLHDHRPEYTIMVDKYAVKQYVAEKIGPEYVIPTLGVWEHFDEIDFDKLPNRFVLKCTHDSGGLVIVKDKSKLNKAKVKKKIEECLRHNFYYGQREWPYKNVKPRIIAEQYMEDENAAQGLRDYKFFCFNGNAKLLYVSSGLENHATAQISFYDMKGNAMPFARNDYRQIEGKMIFPDTFTELTRIANELAKIVDAPFVRIDLYSIYGNIYFSEITFFPCSGMLPIEPAEWDRKLGEWIKLPKEADRSSNG